MAEYRFPDDVRPYVKSLSELLYFANAEEPGTSAAYRKGSRWAWQSSDPAGNGVFGHAMSTVESIICEVHGEELLNRINCSRYGWNFGGNGSWMEDIEVAVETALEEIKEEKLDRTNPRCEWCGERTETDQDKEMRAHKGCVLLNSDYGPDGR